MATQKEVTGSVGEYYAMVTGRVYAPALRLNKKLQKDLRRTYNQTIAPSEKSFELAKQISALVIEELVLSRQVRELGE